MPVLDEQTTHDRGVRVVFGLNLLPVLEFARVIVAAASASEWMECIQPEPNADRISSPTSIV